MLAQILIVAFVVALAFSLIIKWIVSYHFRKFALPEDKMAKKIISRHKWGTIVIALFCVALLIMLVF